MDTSQEKDVAAAAYFMGYDLMRGPEGYVLVKKFGGLADMVAAPTLEEITNHLKH
jgi:hypothetical protein